MSWLFTSLFVLVPLIWLPWTSELFEFNKLMLTYIIAILIACVWAIKCILAKKIIFKRTALDIPLLLFLISIFLSLIFSIDTHVSWYGYYSRWNGGLLSLITYSFLYWAYVSNMDRKDTLLITHFSLLSAVIIAIYGTFEHFGHSASCFLVTGSFDVSCWVQDVQNRVYATMGQPNWLAAYTVSLIFIPISNLLNLKFLIFNFKSIFNILIFNLLFITLLFTKSRSGLLAFGISSVVFWGLYFLKNNSPRPPLKLRGGVPMYFGTGVILFIICTLGLTFLIKNPIRDLVFKPTVVEKSVGPALESGGTESGSIRKIVWKGAVKIWLGNVKNFMIGSGPETFAQVYYQYRPIEHNQTSEWELLYNKAHNEFLNQLATTGILGFGSYLFLLGSMLFSFIYKFKHQTSNIKSNSKIKNLNFELDLSFVNLNFVIALLAGWLTISVTNFWGFSVVVTQILLFLLPAMAITLYTEEVQRFKGSKAQSSLLPLHYLLLCASATLSLCALWLVTRYWYSDFKYANGNMAQKGYQETQDPQYLLLAYQEYYDAFQGNSSEPALASDLSLSAAYLALAMRNQATASSQLAAQSLSLSQIAIKTSPNHPNYYKNLTRSLILLSELDDSYLDTAKQAMQAAAIISPTDPRIPYYLGIILQAQGSTPEARLYFQKSLNLKPDFLDATNQLQKLDK
mgnify:FL=1